MVSSFKGLKSVIWSWCHTKGGRGRAWHWRERWPGVQQVFREALQGSGGSGLVSAWVPVAAVLNWCPLFLMPSLAPQFFSNLPDRIWSCNTGRREKKSDGCHTRHSLNLATHFNLQVRVLVDALASCSHDASDVHESRIKAITVTGGEKKKKQDWLSEQERLHVTHQEGAGVGAGPGTGLSALTCAPI